MSSIEARKVTVVGDDCGEAINPARRRYYQQRASSSRKLSRRHVKSWARLARGSKRNAMYYHNNTDTLIDKERKNSKTPGHQNITGTLTMTMTDEVMKMKFTNLLTSTLSFSNYQDTNNVLVASGIVVGSLALLYQINWPRLIFRSIFFRCVSPHERTIMAK